MVAFINFCEELFSFGYALDHKGFDARLQCSDLLPMLKVYGGSFLSPDNCVLRCFRRAAHLSQRSLLGLYRVR